MNEWLRSLPALAPVSVLLLTLMAGAVLGVLFFGGLWWTARRSLVSPRPALWVLGSVLLRMGLVLPGFFVLAGGRLERLLACLVGFMAARALITWKTRPPRGRVALPQGAGHAP